MSTYDMYCTMGENGQLDQIIQLYMVNPDGILGGLYGALVTHQFHVAKWILQNVPLDPADGQIMSAVVASEDLITMDLFYAKGFTTVSRLFDAISEVQNMETIKWMIDHHFNIPNDTISLYTSSRNVLASTQLRLGFVRRMISNG